ncbi:ankyrin repeat [Fusarium acutatum]|uniref:Ankyrin repeat n=1 Tax=Fusarium acutatum TaxID=78861 RepID=A0A8H4NDU3_9HYPO|nr:ankyrin repeat [Fusarium acutatum]
MSDTILHSHGHQIGVKVKGEFTIIWEAMWLGKDKLVQVILESVAQITDSSVNEIVLISAVTEGFVGVVQIFVDHGADINIRNSHNATLLILAARFGHKDLVNFLLDHGAYFSIADFWMWLDQAITILEFEWSTETVQAFLQRLTDICWAGEDGIRLLNLAAEWPDHEIVQMCLAKGVDVNCVDPYGNAALIDAILWYRGQTPIIEGWPQNGNLISVHESINTTDRRAVVVALLDHGTNPNIGGAFYNDFQVPPLLCAARQGLDWAVEELIGRGVDCNVRAEFIHRRGAIRRLLSSAFRGTPAKQGCKDMIEEGGSALIFAALWSIYQ